MTRIICIIIIALPFLMLFQVLSATGQGEQQNQKEWTGKLVDGKILTRNNLENILAYHNKWVETNQKEGKRADLSSANLIDAYLCNANLMDAVLNSAELNSADLDGAELLGAELNGADLYRAHMHGAYLTLASLRKADLSSTDLSSADLSSADLREANLSSANLRSADLRDADLRGAILSGAELNSANLHGAQMIGADLRRANLQGAILSSAYLIGANLSSANLSDTELSNANIEEADLSKTIFEPKPKSVPNILNIDYAQNLAELKYIKRPNALVTLRSEFKEGGLRRQERQITYAIKCRHREELLTSGNLFDMIEGVFNYVFFEITCKYGMEPGLALILLIPLIIIFTIPYTITLKSPLGKDGIWKIWITERVRKDLGEEKPIRLNLRFISSLSFGFYFSILSAFSIGWRELNVGNWIHRIQPKEYTLRATGWVRTVSGIQSIISVYLVALWVLSYFGRPFE